MNNSDFQIILGNEDVSALVNDVSFSATDPGGFESASLTFPRNLRIPRGTTSRIFYGNSVAWEGRVNEINRQLSAQPNTQLACQGFGARFKDNGGAMVFVDRDLSVWRASSRTLRISRVASSRTPVDASVVPDTASGDPSIVAAFAGPWGGGNAFPICEMFYDAGALNTIGSIYYEWTKGANVDAANANWHWHVLASDQDGSYVNSIDSGNLRAAGPGSGTLIANSSNRYGVLQMFIDNVAAAGGLADTEYAIYWRRIAVYGNHGISVRGSSPGGFFPWDIVSWVLGKAYPTTGIKPGIIEQNISYVIPHSVYPTPVPWEQMIDDMAKFAGFHFGTWEGPGLDLAPRFDFRSRPAAANAWISQDRVDDLLIDDSLDGLYNVAVVTYRTVDGAGGAVTCTRSVGRLDDMGITRTLYIDMGIGDSATATAFGNVVLAIADLNAGTTGSFKTYQSVMVQGGDKPAFMLRPGLDRLKITDMMTGEDSQTEMNVKRIECTVDDSGPLTSVELGQGADFIDTLTTRLTAGAVSPVIAGYIAPPGRPRFFQPPNRRIGGGRL